LTDLSELKADFSDLMSGKGTFNADVFTHPHKYIITLPLEKIVADSKVSRKGVESYKKKISNSPNNRG
jgi:hypothetical protein